MKILMLAALGMFAMSETDQRVTELFDCVVPRAQLAYSATGMQAHDAVNSAFHSCQLRTVRLDSAIRAQEPGWTKRDMQGLLLEYKQDVIEILVGPNARHVP